MRINTLTTDEDRNAHMEEHRADRNHAPIDCLQCVSPALIGCIGLCTRVAMGRTHGPPITTDET